MIYLLAYSKPFYGLLTGHPSQAPKNGFKAPLRRTRAFMNNFRENGVLLFHQMKGFPGHCNNSPLFVLGDWNQTPDFSHRGGNLRKPRKPQQEHFALNSN